MHPVFLLAALCPPLFVLILSDFRRREIGTLWLLVFGVLSFVCSICYFGGMTVVIHLLSNLTFLTLLYGFLAVYTRTVRHESLHRAIGAGDLLFLPVLSPLFPLREFVLFLTASFILSLAGWGVYTLLTRRDSTIPLVGTVGICFIGYFLFQIYRYGY